MNYDLIISLSGSLFLACVLWLTVDRLMEKRLARKRRQAVYEPDFDVNNPINGARFTRPGVGEVDENGFTRLW